MREQIGHQYAQEKQHVGYPYTPVIKRASATTTRETEEDGEGYEDSWPGQSTLPTSSRSHLAHARQQEPVAPPRRDAEDTHVTPRSAIRYQPQPLIPQKQYVIPLTNGKGMRVTERELADLPEDYQEAAQLVTPRSMKQPQVSPSEEVETRTGRQPRQKRRVQFHWLVFVGIGLFIMIVGWLSFSALSSWWNTTWDDIHYGRPRTFQTDQVVGHNGDSQAHPSHFIAINLNGHVEVIEFPAGDGSKARIYLGPQLFGNGEDLAAVTLSFEDRNNDGKPDLNIHIEGSDKVIVFLNDGKAFKPAPNQQ